MLHIWGVLIVCSCEFSCPIPSRLVFESLGLSVLALIKFGLMRSPQLFLKNDIDLFSRPFIVLPPADGDAPVYAGVLHMWHHGGIRWDVAYVAP